MNRHKASLLDHLESPKILYGPHASAASAHAARELDADERYRVLRARLEAAGFFERATAHFIVRSMLLGALFVTAYTGLLLAPATWLRIGAAVVLGFVAVQGCFLGHEAAHGAITRRRWVVATIGHVFGTLIVGYSFTYFWRSHDLHHFHCNEERGDPDTQSDLFSVFASSRCEKRGLGRLLTACQHVAIPLLLPVWALVLKWDGITYVARNLRRCLVDAVLLVLHFALWFVLPALAVGWLAAAIHYFAWCFVAGIYLGLIIPLNHIGMPSVPPEREPLFLEQQISTSRNLPSSFLHDLFFIGLNSQIEHHLFPYVPTIRLRRGRAITRAFCAEHGLPYTDVGVLDAYRAVYDHLAGVAGGHVSQPRIGSSWENAAECKAP